MIFTVNILKNEMNPIFKFFKNPLHYIKRETEVKFQNISQTSLDCSHIDFQKLIITQTKRKTRETYVTLTQFQLVYFTFDLKNKTFIYFFQEF